MAFLKAAEPVGNPLAVSLPMTTSRQITIFILSCFFANGQTLNQKFIDSIRTYGIIDGNVVDAPNNCYKYDCSSVWAFNDSIGRPLGFIGDKYQRIEVIILKSSRSKMNEHEYLVSGKSRVKDNICSFKGVMTVKKIFLNKEMRFGVDSMYKDSGFKEQCMTVGTYRFFEDTSKKHSGIFEGTFASRWFVDKAGNVKYDNIESGSDTYWNNAFVGTWTEHKSHESKICNWGDHRIMYSGDLDIGAGEFSPNPKYRANGWQTFVDALNGDFKAREHKETKWW